MEIKPKRTTSAVGDCHSYVTAGAGCGGNVKRC
jgi:hypothetical protein